jgi:hypothetical protein
MSEPRSAEDNLFEKIRSLPPERVAEVEDFVDFLRARNEEARLGKAAAKSSEPAFQRVWDNPADADYDRL